MLADSGGILSLGVTKSARIGIFPWRYINFRNNATTYAGVRLHSNGLQYYKNPSGTYAQETAGTPDPWLIIGSNDGFWARCTVDAGSLNDDNSGTGSWLQLDTTRSWSIVDTVAGPVPDITATITLEIATDDNGDDVIATQQFYLEAHNSNEF